VAGFGERNKKSASSGEKRESLAKGIKGPDHLSAENHDRNALPQDQVCQEIGVTVGRAPKRAATAPVFSDAIPQCPIILENLNPRGESKRLRAATWKKGAGSWPPPPPLGYKGGVP